MVTYLSINCQRSKPGTHNRCATPKFHSNNSLFACTLFLTPPKPFLSSPRLPLLDAPQPCNTSQGSLRFFSFPSVSICQIRWTHPVCPPPKEREPRHLHDGTAGRLKTSPTMGTLPYVLMTFSWAWWSFRAHHGPFIGTSSKGWKGCTPGADETRKEGGAACLLLASPWGGGQSHVKRPFTSSWTRKIKVLFQKIGNN